MGEIVVKIGLENTLDRELAKKGRIAECDVRQIEVEAIADTGAMMLALPEGEVARLGIDVVDWAPITFADGQRTELPIAGPITIRLGTRTVLGGCVVLPPNATALLGQVVMEEMDLILDPARQTIGPRNGTWDKRLLRL